MTWYFSFISKAEGPECQLNASGTAFLAGRLPPRIIPAEKSRSLGVSLDYVRHLIEVRGLTGGAIDWGSVGVLLTGQELQDEFRHHPEFAQQIALLDPDAQYVLVAAEGG